jgi:hypothetical protein
MRNLSRRALTCLAALLLLAAMLVTVLWGRARWGHVHRLSVLAPSGRFALRLDPDRVRLIGPPAQPAGGQDPDALRLAATMRNAHLGWSIPGTMMNGVPTERGDVHEGFPSPFFVSSIAPAQAHYISLRERPAIRPAALAGPLSRALEDPDRWVVAHYLLWRDGPWRTGGIGGDPLVRQGDVYVRNTGGLRVELPVPGPDTPRRDYPRTRGGFAWIYRLHGPPRAVIDPAQQAVIRNLWHDRLGVTLAEAPYWAVLLAVVAPAGLWLGRAWRGARVRRRRRMGLCPACGYDLRGTPERCPECGAPGAGPRSQGTSADPVAGHAPGA